MRKLCGILAMILALMSFAPALAEQKGDSVEIPIIEAKTFEIPDNEAMAFLRKMGVGWNLGNTFDAYNDALPKFKEMDMETAWHGVKTTEKIIKTVAEAGFTTLRLPVSWHNHVDDEFVISKQWLDRVQEVVDWAFKYGMYVIINIHHDEGEQYFYPDSQHYEISEKYIRSVWSQLSERFRDYDDHLIFESMNEPRLKGNRDYEWNFDGRSDECRDAADCINRLNQVFVDTVRASGGNNAERYLMVPANAANPGNAVTALFVLPEDTADNRIIVSAHAYTPYNFALSAGGTTTFSFKSTRFTGEIDSFLNSLYRKFVSNGIPVVVGEFGARDKGGNLSDRVAFTAYYVSAATSRNIPCCWWDNNAINTDGENFGLLRRYNCKWYYPEIVEAMIRNSAFKAE
ncbi:MAG: glycoside hydrolase family 5 protein [Clostridia bacterium]|nr:glycoside hydrolase family 5 protein [Clostridia bacterium]